MSPSDHVLSVRGLHKTFRIGFFRRRVDAVRGIDFDVQQGEVFGLLGPNGAGKTTTIKMILRLIFPTRGEIRLFGGPASSREAARRIGYLPENPYIYQYLRPLEFLDLCGRLVGLGRRERRARAEALVAQVGLGHAIDRPIGKFSKGMSQRIGLAQALLHDPEVLILDEPMSGLDPIGRKEVRDLLLAERARGKTLVFTSHILSDVERLCDRVAIMHRGKITAHGALSTLLEREGRGTDLELESVDPAAFDRLGERAGVSFRDEDARGARRGLTVADPAHIPAVLRAALDLDVRVVSLQPSRQRLEDLFLERAADAREDAPPPRTDADTASGSR